MLANALYLNLTIINYFLTKKVVKYYYNVNNSKRFLFCSVKNITIVFYCYL